MLNFGGLQVLWEWDLWKSLMLGLFLSGLSKWTRRVCLRWRLASCHGTRCFTAEGSAYGENNCRTKLELYHSCHFDSCGLKSSNACSAVAAEVKLMVVMECRHLVVRLYFLRNFIWSFPLGNYT